jgi:hypothetical protein
MSLEAKLELLTAAVIELTAAIGAMQAPGPVADGSFYTPSETLQKAIKVRGTETPVEKVPNDQPKSSATTSGEPSAPTGESSSPALTQPTWLAEGTEEELKAAHAKGVITYLYAVKPITIRLSKEKGREITIGVLSRFGVKSAQDLDAAQWADYIAHCGKVLEGGEV